MGMFNYSESDIKEQLYEKIRANAETKKITNFNIGGVMRGFLEIVAYFIYLFYELLEKIYLNAYAKTAAGAWLDRKCADVMITRNPSVAVEGHFTFGRTAKLENVKIKVGTLVRTVTNINGEKYTYATTEAAILQSGQLAISIPVRCITKGVKYNISSGTSVNFVSTVSGIDYVNVPDKWIDTYGEDEESDDDLYERYTLQWETTTTGTAAYYQKLALAVSGVLNAKVFPVSRGAGTLDIVITSTEGSPSETLLQAVRDNIEENKFFDGIDVGVISPALIELSLAISLSCSYIEDAEALAENVRTTLNDYFTSFEIGQNFIASRVKTQVLNAYSNVIDVTLSQGTNITLSPRQLLSVTITAITSELAEDE